MKKIIQSTVLSCALMLCMAVSATAQTTALNFTENDCTGVSHTLFSDLDSGKVCVLEFFMLGCQSCVTGANALKTIANSYATSHPNRVKVYTIGYDDNYTCTQINAWKNANNFTNTAFAGGGAQVSYYGGMGMPTIVVVGGPAHQVLYNNQGYNTAQNQPIRNAITAGLVLTVGTQTVQNIGIGVYTNTAQNTVHLQGSTENIAQITLTDLTGKNTYTYTTTETINISQLAQGIYILKLTMKNGQVGYEKIAKQK